MNLEKYQAIVFDLKTLVDQDAGIFASLATTFSRPGAQHGENDLLGQFYRELARVSASFKSSSFVRLHTLAYLNLAATRLVKVGTPDGLAFSRSARSWPLFAQARPLFQHLRRGFRLVILTQPDSPPQPLLLEHMRQLATLAIPTTELSDWMRAQGVRPSQVLHVTLEARITRPRVDKCLVRHETNKRYWKRTMAIDCLSQLMPRQR